MNLTLPTEKVAKPVNHPKKYERQFAQFCVGMVEAMAKQFKNETLLSLNKSTVEKFADAQAGNYSTIFLSMSKAATNKIMDRFTDIRLKKYIQQLLKKVNKFNRDAVYSAIGETIGIEPAVLMQQEALSPDFNALIAETTMWVETLRDECLQRFTTNTLRLMTQGASLDEILASYELGTKKQKEHAKFVARNQIASFNNLSSKLRYQNLGITEGVWRTSHDERVRKSHNDRNGKRFNLSEGLYSSIDRKTILPGTDYNCRCTFSAVIPEAE